MQTTEQNKKSSDNAARKAHADIRRLKLETMILTAVLATAKK